MSEAVRIARAAIGGVALSFTLIDAAGAQRGTPANLRDFDAYAAKAMKDWKVPGMAIAIVRDDSVVFAKGYGVRKLGDPTPVDPRTVFAIGSSTKAFTSAAVAMLVDDGKMKWDVPVTAYVPGFQMRDMYATYADSMYGDVAVRATNGRLTLNYAGVSDGVLEHWHYDTFRAVWANRLLGKSMVTFVIDATAKVAEMKIENLADFKRVAAKADTAMRDGQGASTDAASGAGARSSVLAQFPVRPPSAARATSRSLPTGWR